MKTTGDEHHAAYPSPVDAAAGDVRKQARRRERAEARIRLRAELPPEAWDRFRILSDFLKTARQVVELCDHKVRYALIIVGALNAGVLAVTSRARLGDLSPAAKPWLVAVLVLYVVLTLAFALQAMETLRPRRFEAASPDSRSGPKSGGGLFDWEAVAQQEVDRYHEAWETVRLGQINREAEALFHAGARLVVVKHRALRRLYAALMALVILATVLLGGVAWFSLSAA